MGDSDPAQSGHWSVRESFVFFVFTNLPVVYPLIRGVVEKGRTSLGRSNGTSGAGKSGLGASRSRNGNGGAYRLDSYPGTREQQQQHLGRDDLESGGTSKENIVPHVYDDQASQNSDSVMSDHQVAVVANRGNIPEAPRKEQFAHQASVRASGRRGSNADGIVVTREYDLKVSGDGRPTAI